MLANYHTHTFRCNHANGTEREYIETAIERGLQVLGFSDHVPYPFEEIHYSDFRMRMAELAPYFETLRHLKSEYQKDIEILIGFEAEYYPDYFGALLSALQPFHYDYLILGQHFIGNEMHAPYMAVPTRDKSVLTCYVNQCIDALKTGEFVYLAHPDLPNFIGEPEFYQTEMARLCKAAKELNIPLEFNLLGFSTGRHYPCARFFKLAADMGNGVILGCDAHSPNAVANPDVLKKAEEFLQALGISVLPKLEIGCKRP